MTRGTFHSIEHHAPYVKQRGEEGRGRAFRVMSFIGVGGGPLPVGEVQSFLKGPPF